MHAHRPHDGPGARDQDLANGIEVRPFTVSSSLDGCAIPMLMYSLKESGGETSPPAYAILYIHGGGLRIDEADSEELPYRRILKNVQLPGEKPTLIVYSVGYRLMREYLASTCVADTINAYRYVRAAHPDVAATKLLVVGSSSVGELASFVAPGGCQGSR